MTLQIQYDLFLTREEVMLDTIESMQKSLDKMRKAQFAQISEVKKIAYDLKSKYEILEQNICKNNTNLFTVI